MRPSRHQIFMEVAQTFAKRSTCCRLNVGAVIVRDRTIIAHGYNGPPAGEPHCEGNTCEGMLAGCQRAIHAEINALQRVPTDIEGPWDLYVTDSPCPHCLFQIEVWGKVTRIFFHTPYRINEHLMDTVVEVYRILPAGYILDWKTKKLVDVEI